MAHVGGQGQRVSADIVPAFRTGLERPDREGVPQILNARTVPATPAIEANGLQEITKRPVDGVVAQLRPCSDTKMWSSAEAIRLRRSRYRSSPATAVS